MTVCIAVVATAVALAAAVRSTWSPCGLSMLSTITPLSERAKGNRYRSTAGWFVAGAVVGGASLGALMGLMALGIHALHLSSAVLGSAAFAASLIAAGSDVGVGGLRLPIHRRQVNERWLDRYRPWVYGAGFGWQIGTGLATYITTAAVYLMIVLGGLSASPVVGLLVGTGFGTIRGLAVLLTRHLKSPTALVAFHRRFTVAGPAVARAVVGTELAGSVVLAVALRSPLALAVAGAAAAVAAVSVTRGRRALAR